MRLAVLTSGRQDWGILRRTSLLLRDDARFDLRLLIGGMHCSPEYGRTEARIYSEGLVAAERLPWLAAGDAEPTEDGARALAAISGALQRQTPDALVLVGDRLETAAAALAATLNRVPIIHLHGGEVTGGAFDDALRNAVTKLSHLHLVSHPVHAARVIAMGEDPDSVHIVGAPGLDNLLREDLPGRHELERILGIRLKSPVVIVTVHPSTLGSSTLAASPEAAAVSEAMNRVDATYVISLPNSDPGSGVVRAVLEEAATDRPRRTAQRALGDTVYWGLLRIADAMLGNSSSGLIEAAALRLPVVNVGDRQAGRLRGGNVIDAEPSGEKTAHALQVALDPATRLQIEKVPSPYPPGLAAERIIEVLASWAPPNPPRKPLTTEAFR
jgi:UDP-hydrolysing UDP-N-acetyl-D-glucosamine 2-epimerase